MKRPADEFVPPQSTQQEAPQKKTKSIPPSLPAPSAAYELSLAHTAPLVAVEVAGDSLVSADQKGFVKFWKRSAENPLVFVRTIRPHTTAPSLALAADSALIASVSHNCIAVATINPPDLFMSYPTHKVKVGGLQTAVVPSRACFVSPSSSPIHLLAVALTTPHILIFNTHSPSTDPIRIITTVHQSPVACLAYNPLANVVVSVDKNSFIEYWSPSTTISDSKNAQSSLALNFVENDSDTIRLSSAHPSSPKNNPDKNNEKDSDADKGFAFPKQPIVSFSLKSETDLYDLKRCKAPPPSSIVFAPDFSKFATFGIKDRTVRIFDFKSAKITRKYDESLQVAAEMQQAGTAFLHLDDMEFGRRLAMDKDLEKSFDANDPSASAANIVFDESGSFLFVPSLIGIKLIHIQSNRVVSMIGSAETIRFLNIALYQGSPIRHSKPILSIAMAASDNPIHKSQDAPDPILFCTAFRKNRFYLFSHRQPDDPESAAAASATGRDIYNEKPSREEQALALAGAATTQSASTPSSSNMAIIHTSLGDITIRLYPDIAPKAVHNFITLSKSSYYTNTIFHRVIKNFMIQTGDPLGDGTGGESCYGHDFADEFSPQLRHNAAYMVSMANCGPNTNASQFFITTVPTPWLDDKHTIFGKLMDGMDVVHRIEKTQTDKNDKPLMDIRIIGIDIK